MNITKESNGVLTALLKVEISPADYNVAVEKQIMDYKRKANVPGFRPGHIPTGLIKKMYGKAILADEVNRLISESLINFIKEEKIDILGNPLPNMEKNSAIDFEHQDTFEFYFDIGLTPEFSIPIGQDLNIDNYTIIVDNEMVNKYVEDTRKRYGKPLPAEPAGEDLTDTAQPKEEEQVKLKEPAIEPAALNPEFYNLVFPGLDLQSETDFREEVKKGAALSFAEETDKLLFNTITETLVKNTEIALPDEFLKRWLLENNEGKYTPEEVEKNYTSFLESMKWQLIENKLIKEYNITVTDKEIRNYISTNMLRQINIRDMDPEMQKRYDSIIDTFMENKEQVRRINDQLYNAKLMEYFKANMTVHPKEITYDEYIKLASAMHQHDHEHEHLHNHEHEHKHDNDNDHEHNHQH